MSIFILIAVVAIQDAEPDRLDSFDLGGKQLKLVFSDDFENGRNRWKTTDDAAWQIFSRDENKTFGITKRKSDYQPKYRSPHNIALLNERTVEDFVLEFDVKSTKNTGDHRDCCVFFAYQDSDNFYYVHLGAKPDPKSGQIMIVKNAPRKALTNNKKPVSWDEEWHKVRLTFESRTGKICVYFDDMNSPLMSVTDQTFSGGKIGIGSFDDMNEFDNVKLYGD